MTPVTLKFTHKAETKNKQRFEEDVAEGATAVVGTIYIGKEVAGDSKTLTVTIA